MTRSEFLPVHLLLVSSLLVSGCAMAGKQTAETNSSLLDLSQTSSHVSDAKGRAEIAVASGRLAEESGDSSRAMSLYSEAIALNPQNADAHWRQARALSGLQQFDEANGAFKKAIELNESNAALYTDYGYHLYLQDRFAEAEEALRTAIRLEPDQQRSHNNLGLVLSATGREAEAIASFRDAGCSESDAQANLGFVQAMSNDLTQARSTFRSALAMDPSSKNSSRALQQLNKLVVAAPDSDILPVTYSMSE